ncbi:MAG: metallophosphoesterase family protein [Chloroflexota bacterium]|nr:metallophosphoesterase family protein [Chloroflexota bacterium]
MKLLCASDLHLGRRASGVPEHLGLDSARFATSAVWEQAVETALRERVDLVLLAGDVVDRENRLFEARGPLERGLNTLARHGIPVYAVAGEHDFDTLRQVADAEGAELKLLGRDGHWQTVTVEKGGRPVLRLAGWSAPGQSSRGSVLAGFAEVAAGEADVPLLALLHGTVSEEDERSADAFAPLARAELARHGVALWVVGHTHSPRFVSVGESALLEPGAISPLRPAETGSHGIWIVDVDSDGAVTARLVTLSPVRFEHLSVDLTGTAEATDVEAALIRALHDTLSAALRDDPHGQLVCLSCHVTIRGHTRLHGEVATIAHDLARTLDIQKRGVVAAINGVADETRPPLDLEPLVGRPDSVGEIARLLAALERDDPEEFSDAQRELLGRTVTRLQSVHRARVFAAVAGDREPDIADAKRHLRRQGWDVLASLIQQRGVE